MSKRSVSFYNFGTLQKGTLVTHFICDLDDRKQKIEVVYCRNQYGTHNLVLVEDGEAIRHGYEGTMSLLSRYYYWGFCPKKVIRKAFFRLSSVKGSPWWEKKFPNGFGDQAHNFVLKYCIA